MKVWQFQEGVHKSSSEWARQGKPEWPDMVAVTMPRARAVRLAMSLLEELLGHPQASTIDLPMPLMGRLSQKCLACAGDGFTEETDTCPDCKGTGEVDNDG